MTGDERRVRPGAVIGSLRRHPGVALAAFALPVALVVGALLVLPREFEATGAVRLDPVAVPALDPSWPLDADPSDAVALEVALAEGEFRAAMEDALDFPFDYEVRGDPADGTVTFEARAGSSVEAWATALAAVAGFSGLHGDVARVDRTIAATTAELEAVDAALADPATASDPVRARGLEAERAALGARLERYAADREAVVAGIAETIVEPVRPTEPARPPFVPLVGVAVLAGAGAAVAASAWVDRRSPGRRPPAAAPSPRPAVAALGVVTAVLAPGLLVVVGLTGWHTVWELRRVTDQQVEDQVACTGVWLAEVPAGATIFPQPEPAEARDEFWVAALSQSAFPRLGVAQLAEDADHLVQVVPQGDPAGGRLPCAGYEVVITER